MKPLRIHAGKVAPLDRINVDTDQIIPKQFLKRIERTGYGDFLFYDWRLAADGTLKPDFALNSPKYKDASILLARRNFGCGSSREHAAWALSMEISLCLFRVLQEGLQNAAKHSGVRHFSVELLGGTDEIQLTVSDLGVGFDPNGAVTNRHGLGLISMRERLRLANGEFSIKSGLGRGTTIRARIPLGTTKPEASQSQRAS